MVMGVPMGVPMTIEAGLLSKNVWNLHIMIRGKMKKKIFPAKMTPHRNLVSGGQNTNYSVSVHSVARFERYDLGIVPSRFAPTVDTYWAQNKYLQNVISTTQAGLGRLV